MDVIRGVRGPAPLYRWILALGLVATALVDVDTAHAGCDPLSQCCGVPSGGGSPCGTEGVATLGEGSGVSTGAGNPINLVSGNKFQREVDLPALPGVLGLEVVRYYNSHASGPSKKVGLFGRGWRLSYEAELVATHDERAIDIVQADGATLHFERASAAVRVYVGSDVAQGRVIVEAGMQYRWCWPNGRTLLFDRTGKLVQITAPTGEFVTLAYDARGRLAKVIDPQQRTLSVNLARVGAGAHAASLDTPIGRIAYTHGAAATLVEARLPAAASQPVAVRRYLYEDATHPTLLTGITMQRGDTPVQRLGTYGYDAIGRAVRTEGGGERITLARPSTDTVVLTDGRGAATTYTLRTIDGQPRIVEARGPGCPSCSPGNMRYAYDTRGRLIEHVRLDAEGRPRVRSRIERDAIGRVAAVWDTPVDAQGRAQPARLRVRYAYAFGVGSDPTLIIRPSVVPGREHTLSLAYNTHGQLTRITEGGVAPGAPLDAADGAATPIERTTTFEYETVNARSVLVAVHGPAPDDITRYTWDARGDFVTDVDPGDGRALHIDHDAAGRWTHTSMRDGPLRIALDARYDEASAYSAMPSTVLQAAWRVDAAGRVQASSRLVRRIELVRGAGGTLYDLRIDGDEVGAALVEQIRSLTRGNGMQADATAIWTRDVRVERDAWSRPTAWLNDVEGATRAGFDAAPGAEPSLRAQWGSWGSSAMSTLTALTTTHAQALRRIDDFGRVVAIKTPAQAWKTARYDAAGRQVEARLPDGARHVATWDAQGRLSRVDRYAPAATAPEQTLRWTWTDTGVERAVITDADGSRITETERDTLGRMVRQRTRIEPAGALARQLPPLTFELAYAYDAQGRLVQRTLIDAQGARTTVAQHIGVDGEPDRIVTQGGLPAWGGGGRAIVTGMAWQRLPGLAWAERISHGDGSTDRFTLDRHAFDAPAGDGSANNHLLRVTVPSPASPAAWTIPGREPDAAGRPSAIVTAVGMQHLRWNAAGQLVETARDDGGRSRYVYDALGRRIAKAVTDAQGHTTLTLSLYEEHRLIAQADARGRATAAYVYVGHRPVAQLVLEARNRREAFAQWLFGPRVRALHTDRIGRVRSAGGEGDTVPLRYVGQTHDDDSGLDYHGARYYEPGIGRFISPDPQGIADAVNEVAPAALLDPYAYAGGRPDLYFDPDGDARIRYYAITTGANGKALGMTQGFTNARWAFIVDQVQAPLLDGGKLGELQKSYAQHATGLLVDMAGDFLDRGQSAATWQGTNAALPAQFTQHYGANLVSLEQFTVQMSDADATRLIASYLAADNAQLGACASRSALLPQITFAPGEMPINVWRQSEPGMQGENNGANVQRILNCNRPTQLPVTYDSDDERRRLAKYEAAAEIQESPVKSALGRDCSSNHGCRSQNPIIVNGHSYYASYGRTQFVAETFLTRLQKLATTLTPEQRHQLRLDQPVRLPNGSMGTMLDLVDIAKRQSTNAANAFRDYRNTKKGFGKGLTTQQADEAWNRLSDVKREEFKRTTGLGKQEFIDMLGFVPNGRAHTEAEAQNAFGSEGAMKLLDGDRQFTFGAWLMWLYSSQDEYNFVSEMSLKANLSAITNTKSLKNSFLNNEALGTEAYQQRQRQIENELAQRVAVIHNSGSVKQATDESLKLERYLQDYVNEFTHGTGRGDWGSLRCSDDLKNISGLQMQSLRLN